jgi:undecaprenyl diphosphate synthase
MSKQKDSAKDICNAFSIDPTRVPNHVGVVMDGNGRWASQRGLERTEGHAAGESAILESLEAAVDIGVKWYTVYAFSTENWRRPPSEVAFLMKFNEDVLVRRRDYINDLGIRIRFAGRRDWRVPRRLLRRIQESEELTRKNKKANFTVAFNYGGRTEIVDAVQKLVDDKVKKVDERAIQSRLYFPEMPDVDLYVRTSGEYRISNFLLWQLAYSELVFTDVLWPDFSKEHLYAAVREYQNRDRRYGGLSDSSPDAKV